MVSDGTPLADVVVVLRCCCAVQDSPWTGELFRLTFFVAARICREADWHLGASGPPTLSFLMLTPFPIMVSAALGILSPCWTLAIYTDS